MSKLRNSDKSPQPPHLQSCWRGQTGTPAALGPRPLPLCDEVPRGPWRPPLPLQTRGPGHPAIALGAPHPLGARAAARTVRALLPLLPLEPLRARGARLALLQAEAARVHAGEGVGAHHQAGGTRGPSWPSPALLACQGKLLNWLINLDGKGRP